MGFGNAKKQTRDMSIDELSINLVNLGLSAELNVRGQTAELNATASTNNESAASTNNEAAMSTQNVCLSPPRLSFSRDHYDELVRDYRAEKGPGSDTQNLLKNYRRFNINMSLENILGTMETRIPINYVECFSEKLTQFELDILSEKPEIQALTLKTLYPTQGFRNLMYLKLKNNEIDEVNYDNDNLEYGYVRSMAINKRVTINDKCAKQSEYDIETDMESDMESISSEEKDLFINSMILDSMLNIQRSINYLPPNLLELELNGYVYYGPELEFCTTLTVKNVSMVNLDLFPELIKLTLCNVQEVIYSRPNKIKTLIVNYVPVLRLWGFSNLRYLSLAQKENEMSSHKTLVSELPGRQFAFEFQENRYPKNIIVNNCEWNTEFLERCEFDD